MTAAYSQLLPGSDATDFTKIQFILAAALDQIQTASIVQVKAVNTGAQTVDVLVLANVMTKGGQSIPHGVIGNRPYFRLQGGLSGIICDPVVTDIGLMVFTSRDSSAVIAAKGAANPGSQRQFDWADGIYLGGLPGLNAAPTQYVQFLPGGAGINIVSPGTVTINGVTISAAGNIKGPGSITDGGSHVLGTHLHSGVQSGGSDTGPPT